MCIPGQASKILTSFIQYFIFFGQVVQLSGPQFPNQELNQATAVKAWNSNHQATGELPFISILFFWSHRKCDVLLVTQEQKLNLCPLQWKLGVLTSGRPGNSLYQHFKSCGLVSLKYIYTYIIYIKPLSVCMCMCIYIYAQSLSHV